MDLGNIKISESFSVPRNGEYSSSDDPVQGKENLGNFLNDFESYWQDIDDRLTVSRVVSDSVIKGIVNAVSQEATEMVSAKEMIVTELKEQLLKYRRGHLNFQSCFGNNMQDKLKIVSSICQDLDSVQKSLFNLEKLSSHGSLEIDHLHCRVLSNHVEASSRQTESSVSLPETFESSHLKHLKIDELYTYFRDEIAKLKRDHETIIQEITEDYFSLKRDFLKERELLKERGSFFPLKSKDCDALRKTIPDVILKLKDVLSDYEDCCKTCDLSRDTLDNLLMENHNLRDLLNKKVVEIKCLSSQVSEVKAVTKEKEMIIIEEKERSEEVLNKMKDLTAQRLRERALISQKNSELGKLKANLEDCLRKIDQREAQIVKLTKTLELVQLDAKSLLEERDKTCLLLDAKEREYREQTESAVHAIQEMTKAFVNYELRTIESMKWNNVRLENSTFQLGLLLKKVNVLRRTGLLYKQRLERRCSDLQKAEAEVDLLGDEVETLLGLLEKIHIALDHYAPILQHYPGIMEVLKLVERKLSTECAKSICATPY